MLILLCFVQKKIILPYPNHVGCRRVKEVDSYPAYVHKKIENEEKKKDNKKGRRTGDNDGATKQGFICGVCFS